MKKIFFLIFLASCTSQNSNNSAANIDMHVTFDEFKILLKEYDKNKGYPNLSYTIVFLLSSENVLIGVVEIYHFFLSKLYFFQYLLLY